MKKASEKGLLNTRKCSLQTLCLHKRQVVLDAAIFVVVSLFFYRFLSFTFVFKCFGREEGCWGQLSCANFVLNTNPQIKEVLIFLHFPVVVVWLRSQFFVHQACYFVSFKPRKASQFKKDVFSSCRERGTKKKFWFPMRKWVNLCLIRKIVY